MCVGYGSISVVHQLNCSNGSVINDVINYCTSYLDSLAV